MTDRQQIEDFLYYEASLLDQPDLDTWMTLFTEDGHYWMPAIENQHDPINHISHVFDDRVMMEIRRRNFVHPRAPKIGQYVVLILLGMFESKTRQTSAKLFW